MSNSSIEIENSDTDIMKGAVKSESSNSKSQVAVTGSTSKTSNPNGVKSENKSKHNISLHATRTAQLKAMQIKKKYHKVTIKDPGTGNTSDKQPEIGTGTSQNISKSENITKPSMTVIKPAAGYGFETSGSGSQYPIRQDGILTKAEEEEMKKLLGKRLSSKTFKKSLADIVRAHQMRSAHKFNTQAHGLDVLIPVSRIFITRSYDAEDEKHYGKKSPRLYDVVNELGEMMFQMHVHRTKCLGMCFMFQNTFSAILTDVQGEEIIILEAEPGSCGQRGSIKVRGKLEKYGRVVHDGNCWTPDYTALSKTGDHLLKIRPEESVNSCNLGVPLNYGIYHGEYATYLGQLTNEWELVRHLGKCPQYFREILGRHAEDLYRAYRPTPDSEQYSNVMVMYGAYFPEDMPVRLKLLVLATIVMIKFFNNDT